MADKKISQLTNLTGANLADNDEFVLVDTSADETKAITWSELKEGLDTGTGFVRITGDTMTGDLTVPNVITSGNVDGRDVSADGTKLDTIETNADVTDTANVTSAGALMTTGGTLTGNLSFGDNDKAIFGAGSDLQIYHDGSNSYITDTGTGRLELRGSTEVRLASASGEALLRAFENSSVNLYFDNSPKLATTSTGIDVTGQLVADSGQFDGNVNIDGTVTADGLTVDGDVVVTDATPSVTIKRSNTANEIGFTFINSNDVESFKYFIGGNNNDLTFQSRESNVLKLDQGGDISFYEDTGTTPKFFWDASAESLLVGTDSGDAFNSSALIRAQGTDAYIQLKSATTNSAGILFGDTDDDFVGGMIYNNNADALIFNSGNSERLRIDSSGNVGIGTSSPSAKLEVTGAANSKVAEFTSVGGESRGLAISTFANGGFDSTGVEYKTQSAVGAQKFSIGSTEAMRIDSSGNVGIGTSSPQRPLHVVGPFGDMRLEDGDNGSFGEILASNGSMTLRADHGNNVASSFMSFQIDGSEAMRIDSSGNLLVNKTVANNTVVGATLFSSGAASLVASGGITTLFNRLTSDGDITVFQKDSTTVGSIGVAASDNLYVGGNSSHASIGFGTNSVYPATNTGNGNDNDIDLGQSDARFQDLYLSGGVYLGGTGSANKLDDYEEGTWTPTGHNVTLSVNSARYVKTGNVCYLQCYIVMPSTSDTSAMRIEGLPFNTRTFTNGWQAATHWSDGVTDHQFIAPNNNNFLELRALTTGNVVTNASVSTRNFIIQFTYLTS